MKEKGYIKERMSDNREPRQSDWYNLIGSSFGEFYVKDSTEECDFDSDEIVITSGAVEKFLGVIAPVYIVEQLESRTDTLEDSVKINTTLSYDDYVLFEGGTIESLKVVFEFLSDLESGDNRFYSASSIPFIAGLYIDEQIAELLRYFTTHIAYVDYVVFDGGALNSKTETLNFYKEII